MSDSLPLPVPISVGLALNPFTSFRQVVLVGDKTLENAAVSVEVDGLRNLREEVALIIGGAAWTLHEVIQALRERTIAYTVIDPEKARQLLTF